MRRFLHGFFGRRVLPPLILFGLIAVAYWGYSLSKMTTADPRYVDPSDVWFAGIITAVSVASAAYLLLRTDPWTPQMLGIVGFVLGDAILYATIFANFQGWTQVSQERRGDVLRASLTVGGTLYIGGILFFEIVRWRTRGTPEPRRPVGNPTGNDAVIYEGLDRRSGPPDRRGRR